MSSESMDTASLFKALAWLEKNKKQVLYGTVAVLAVAFGIFFVSWRNEAKRVEAGQAFSNVFVEQSEAGTNATAQPYLGMASKYAGSSAAERATLLAATTLFTNSKYPEAQAEFEKFLRENPGSALKPQALLGIAASQEAQGKTEEALNAYKNIVDRRTGETILVQAKFQLARLYEGKKDLKQAYELYKDVSSDPGSFGDEANVRMKELETRDPSLAPTAPATAAVVAPATGTNAAPGTNAVKTGAKK